MKNTLKFKFLSFFVFVLVLLTMASCGKSDDRDQFEGSYKVDAIGSVTIYIGDQTGTVPFDQENESMTITKSSSNATEVLVSGFLDQVATVQGNNIYFESFTETGSQDGLTLNLTFDVKKGTLNGNVLTFKIEVSGNGYYQGYSFPATGTISCVATKN